MTTPIIMPSFAAGELAPSLYSRVDLAKFHVGLALSRNFYIDYRGGASNRPGTLAIGRCKQTGLTPPRNIPFTFNVLQTYILEFGQYYMRVIMDGGWILQPSGGYVYDNTGGYVLEPSIAVTGITQANPAVWNITAHGFSVGDQIFAAGCAGMTEVNSTIGFQLLVQTVVDANHVIFTDLDGNAINSTSYPAYTGSGTVARVYTLVTPYLASDLPLLKYTQNANVMTLTHPSYQPQQLTRTQNYAWSLTGYVAGSSMGIPTAVSVTPSSSGTTGYRYCVTALPVGQGSESRPSTAADTLLSATMSATSGAHCTITWSAPAGGPPVGSYNIYRQPEVAGSICNAGQAFGFVGNTTSTTFVDANILPDLSQTPSLAFNPFASSNYPGCSTYYQNRQVFGASGSDPQTMWMSKTGDYTNMDYSLPSRADDGIVATIASTQVNAIKHLVPMNSMIALTASGAWRVDGGQLGAPITPNSVDAVPQSYNGCTDVPPLVINYEILYVQNKGSIVRDLTYNFYVNVYTGIDLTPLANHLFFGHQIVEWCWAEEPFKLVWAVREDGILLSLTFVKEQEVTAWAHHDTQGKFVSVASVSEGQEDGVFFIVQRKINGALHYYQERLASRNLGARPEMGAPADLSKACFLDCAVINPLTYLNATLTPDAVNGTPAIIGVQVILGGSGYTAPLVQDMSGSGATFSVTLASGVITAVAVVTPGVNVANPILQVTDATGSGAVIQAITSNDLTVTTDLAVFNSGMVGNMLRVNGGWGLVRVYNSTTSVTINCQNPLYTLLSAAPGTWSCSPQITTMTGLDHLNGATVSILADGDVQPQQVVAAGQITLEQPASAVFVGLPYIGQLQSLYLDVGGMQPTVQSKRMKLNAITIGLQDSRGLQIGTDFVVMDEFKEREFQTMGNPILPITADIRQVIEPNYTVTPQICIQQLNPLPATVLSFIPEITVGDS